MGVRVSAFAPRAAQAEDGSFSRQPRSRRDDEAHEDREDWCSWCSGVSSDAFLFLTRPMGLHTSPCHPLRMEVWRRRAARDAIRTAALDSSIHCRPFGVERRGAPPGSGGHHWPRLRSQNFFKKRRIPHFVRRPGTSPIPVHHRTVRDLLLSQRCFFTSSIEQGPGGTLIYQYHACSRCVLFTTVSSLRCHEERQRMTKRSTGIHSWCDSFLGIHGCWY